LASRQQLQAPPSSKLPKMGPPPPCTTGRGRRRVPFRASLWAAAALLALLPLVAAAGEASGVDPLAAANTTSNGTEPPIVSPATPALPDNTSSDNATVASPSPSPGADASATNTAAASSAAPVKGWLKAALRRTSFSTCQGCSVARKGLACPARPCPTSTRTPHCPTRPGHAARTADRKARAADRKARAAARRARRAAGGSALKAAAPMGAAANVVAGELTWVLFNMIDACLQGSIGWGCVQAQPGCCGCLRVGTAARALLGARTAGAAARAPLLMPAPPGPQHKRWSR
jgi:hypothetical protein